MLKNVHGLAFCTSTKRDVVRHHLVQRIVRAYDEHKARLARRADSVASGGQSEQRQQAGSAYRKRWGRESCDRMSFAFRNRIVGKFCRRAPSGPSCLL